MNRICRALFLDSSVVAKFSICVLIASILGDLVSSIDFAAIIILE